MNMCWLKLTIQLSYYSYIFLWMAFWHCSLSFPRLEKRKLKKLIVRNVLKSIICLGFADFSELLVFTSMIVVDVYVRYIAFTSFFSNFRFINCWILNFQISKPVKKNALSSVVLIRFYFLWYYYSNNIKGNFLTVSPQSMQLLFQLQKVGHKMHWGFR